MDRDATTASILAAAIEVHRELGPGLIESVYEVVLAFELESRGHHVQRQHGIRIAYKGLRFDDAFRADLLVDNRVLIELKATARHEPVFARQLVTYLRLLHLSVGLLINFGAPTLMSGVARIVNRYSPDS